MKAGELLNSSFFRIREALDNQEISSKELTEESLNRAKLSQQSLNAFISLRETEALEAADLADRRLQSGERGGVLGVPVSVKDLILVKNSKCTAGSKILENFIAPYDATVVSRLIKAGAPIIGKTNLDEFAMGSSGETSYFGSQKNPWDLSCVPGGSSGGSAAVVAARISPLALGTDTGGSIRQPAAFCGLTGVKPTYGRVSRFGAIAFASSLDQVGPMATDALGAATMLEVISGYDVNDGTSPDQKVPSYAADLNKKAASMKNTMNHQMKGKKIGVPREYFEIDGLSSEVSLSVKNAIECYKSEGAEIVELELKTLRYALPTYYIICTSEASSNLARYSGVHYGHRSVSYKEGSLDSLYSMSRAEGFGDEVKLRILLGTYALSSGYYDAYYKKASQVRRLIKEDFESAFKKCDLIAGPTSPTTAFLLNEKTLDPLAMYASDIYTLSVNLAGLPAISLNVGFDSKGLPIGMQLIAPWWQESSLLEAAQVYQTQNLQTVENLSSVAKQFVVSS